MPHPIDMKVVESANSPPYYTDVLSVLQQDSEHGSTLHHHADDHLDRFIFIINYTDE